jgi:hypothetical protein
MTALIIPIMWQAPEDDGGCPITSYAILRDGGPSSPSFQEVHNAEVTG